MPRRGRGVDGGSSHPVATAPVEAQPALPASVDALARQRLTARCESGSDRNQFDGFDGFGGFGGAGAVVGGRSVGATTVTVTGSDTAPSLSRTV